MIEQTLKFVGDKDDKMNEEARKTFIWLKNSHERSDSDVSEEDVRSKNNMDQIVFDNEIQCMEFED